MATCKFMIIRHATRRVLSVFTKVRDEFKLEDVERGLLWESLGFRDQRNIRAAVLSVRGQRIPHEYYIEPMSQAGAEGIQLRLLGLGGSVIAVSKGIPNFRFESAEHREEVQHYVAEAALSWEPGGKGREKPPGYARFTADDRTFLLSDFDEL